MFKRNLKPFSTGVILAILSLSCTKVFGQKTALTDYIERIESTSDKIFFFRNQWIDSVKVNQAGFPDLDVISDAIIDYGLEVYIHQDKYVFIYPNKLEFRKLQELKENRLSIDDFNNYLRIGNPSNSIGSKEYLLTGIVSDSEGQTLLGASVIVNNGAYGSQSNVNGEYELLLKPGNYTLKTSYVGYADDIRRITLYESGNLDITVYNDVNYLDEVIVEASKQEGDLRKSTIGQLKLEIETMESLPDFLGESDVLKTATILPGVNTAGESSSYLNVRGGGNDQTLVLMNNAPVYNPGHLFGFFSIFNSDFISDVTLFKGNIPASYGLRASSVLDVKMNKWAKKKTEIYGGIGIAKSNIGVRTRLLDNKLDLHIGGRIAYPDWLFQSVPSKNIFQSSANFGDINFSSKYALSNKSTLRASAFYGTDYFKYADLIVYEWRMFNGSLEWNQVLSNSIVFTSNVVIGGLENTIEGLEFSDEYILKNGISNYGWTNSISINLQNHTIDTGVEMAVNTINTGEIDPNSINSNVESVAIDEEGTRNVSLFMDYESNLNNGFILNLGVRFSRFTNLGSGISNEYASGLPLEPENVIGQFAASSSENVSNHLAFEPRLGINYEWSSNSVKFGYSRTNQFLHLLSNSALVNPVSVWKGSDQFISPTQIDQYSLGYVKELKDGAISLSVEGFYKNIEDLVEYKDGSEIVLNEHVEQEIIQGDGRAYGLEFYATHKSDQLNVWLSYTYSRAFITTNSEFDEEIVNNGEEYNYYTDRPHSLLLSTDYDLSKKWSISSTFTYSSGAPTTAPATIYDLDGVDIPYFPSRNKQRIPSYHRLDLAITYKSRIRKNKKNKDKWVLSIYNVYARSNASSVFFARDEDGPSRPFQFISVGTMIPTLTYKFEF